MEISLAESVVSCGKYFGMGQDTQDYSLDSVMKVHNGKASENS